MSKAITLLIVFFLGCGIVSAQITQNNEAIPPPSEETFKAVDGVIKDDLMYTGRKYADIRENETIRIYNADGSVWYEFSVQPNAPLNFAKNPKPEFKPLVPFHIGYCNIKATGISKNWYEVVVNEETQETKYILINDPITTFVPFETMVLDYGEISFDNEKNPILETPNGKIKKVLEDGKEAFPRKIEGDWLCVMQDDRRKCNGWIRWRKDRKILIGYILNENVIPEQ